MDSIALSFPFPPSPLPAAHSETALSSSSELLALYQQLCDDARKLHSCQIELLPPPDSAQNAQQDCFTVSLSGSYQNVMAARATLMRRNPSRIYTTLRVNRNYLLQPNGELKATMKSKLDDIMKMTDTEITILGEFPSHLQPPPGITQEMTAIEISGVRENVELARVKFLVLLDELSGLFCDALEIDLKLHNIIAGRKHQDLHRIMKITYTNIYLPSPFCIQAHHLKSVQPQVAWEHQIPPGYGQIFITGDHSNVQQAKDMLVASIMRPIRTFNVTVMPRKIDWIATHKKESLLKIMRDNGTFIALPPLGSSSNIITVYGDNMVYIQRSIRMIARLACDFYVACFRIVPPLNQNRPMNSAGHDLSKLPPLNQIAAFIKQITSTSLAEIVYNNSFFEVYGFDRSVADAYERISQMDFVKNSPRETKFQLELGQEHREFISGKKNGKINKIIKSTGVKVNFENFNEYNMVIDILSPYFDKALEGLFLLKDELPAEISFHVPEAFHKRIIGVGGKNIQRIMKKFGVFVKFSNAEEHEALGGYFENEDNVIARTPAKNAFNLLNLKQTVMELVNPKDHEVLHYLTSIPLRYHRVMEPQIPSIENAAGVKIQISDREKGSDEVLVIGYESNIKLALQLLSDCTAEDYEFRVPASTNLMITIGSMKFKESVVDRIAREFDITLVAPVPNTKEEMDSMTMDKGEYKFIFRCLKRTVKYLEEAKKMLNDYLSANGVSLYQKPNTLMRIDSVPLGEVEKPFDSFRHFNSKLFSAATIADTKALTASFSNFSLFDNSVHGSNERLTGSAPNLRAIFDNSAFVPSITTQQLSRAESEDLKPPSAELKEVLNSLPDHLLSPSSPYDQQQPKQQQSQFIPTIHRSLSGTGYPSMPNQPNRLDDMTHLPNFQRNPMIPMMASSAVAPSSASNKTVKVPSDKYCGLKMSLSVPGELGDKLHNSSKVKTPLRTAITASESLKGLSSTSVVQDEPDSPTLPKEVIQQVLAEGQRSKEKLKLIFESLELTKYLSSFIDQEVDFDVFITLTDSDLKELGIQAFGSRKKLLNAIRDIRNAQNKLSSSSLSPCPSPSNSAVSASVSTSSAHSTITAMSPTGPQFLSPNNRMLGVGVAVGSGIGMSMGRENNGSSTSLNSSYSSASGNNTMNSSMNNSGNGGNDGNVNLNGLSGSGNSGNGNTNFAKKQPVSVAL